MSSKRNAGIKHNFTTKLGDVAGDFIGLKGEYAVAAYFGVPFDDTISLQGDGGVDLIVGDNKIEVKTSSKSNGRIIQRPLGKRNKGYDFLVFCTTGPDSNNIYIIGWCTYAMFRDYSRMRYVGYGQRRRVMTQEWLRPMEELNLYNQTNADAYFRQPEEQIDEWDKKLKDN